jgi:hypothetical protein
MRLQSSRAGSHCVTAGSTSASALECGSNEAHPTPWQTRMLYLLTSVALAGLVAVIVGGVWATTEVSFLKPVLIRRFRGCLPTCWTPS